MGASHFVFGCDFLGYPWCQLRYLVRTASGRKRYNILGAINYCTGELLTITNTEYITASEVCALFRKIRETHGDAEMHITLDNARYQKCEIVRGVAESMGIHLDYIPHYSPNLNVIEIFWKYVKGRVANQVFETFQEFTAAIDSILAGTTTEFKQELDSLICNVQQFHRLIDIDGKLAVEGAA